MSKSKNSKRQKAGANQSFNMGLPKVCPLLNIDDKTGAYTCKQTEEKLDSAALCELDTDTNIDYRLCDVFSGWFWALAKQQENEAMQTKKAIENTPT